MPDQLITTSVIPGLPGIYGVIQTGQVPTPGALGILAVVGKSSWGPLGAVTTQGSAAAVQSAYGPASSVDRTSTVAQLANLAREGGNGGAITFQCVRAGTGGTAASLTPVNDTGSPTNVGHLNAIWNGVFGNTFTCSIGLVPGSSTVKQLQVFGTGNVLLQRNTFPAASGDEAAGLATATIGAPYVTFTKVATGNGILATITQVSLSGGVDPTVGNSDYSTALNLLSPYPWQALCTDSEATAVFATIQQFCDSEISNGRFRFATVGEATSVSESTRNSDAAAINSAVVRYIGNGFVFPNGDGTLRNDEGFLAAAYDAGVQATLGPGQPMTWRTVPGATGLVVPAAGPAVANPTNAKNNGMDFYQFSPTMGIRTALGCSTLVNVGLPPIWAQGLNTGWQHTEHAATAFNLMTEIDQQWQQAIGNPDPTQRPGNTAQGRATLVALANRITKKYIDRGWIQSGTCIVDPNNPPTGNLAYFTFQQLVVALRAERLVMTLPFGQP